MAKHHHKRNYFKQSAKHKQKAIKEPEIPEISEEELAENYRKNTRKTIWGIVAIFVLMLVIFIFVAIDVSGCQFVETEEEYENCRSYSLLEKIFYGGPAPAVPSADESTNELNSTDEETDESTENKEEN